MSEVVAMTTPIAVVGRFNGEGPWRATVMGPHIAATAA
jgi:hypothetical protein